MQCVDSAAHGPGRRTVRLVALLALLASAASCVQDNPGLAPQQGPQITSDTLGACPPGGPDATTAPAGCLDEDGRVVRP